MKKFDKFTRALASFGVAFTLGFGLSACSSGIGDTELELNGKVFDALGITSSGKSGEQKLAQRAPLVLPPDDKKLPAPGSSSLQPNLWPDDPDARKIALARLAKKKKHTDCNGGDFKKKQDIDAIKNASDPLRDCKSGNFLTAIGIGRSDKGEEE